MSDTSNIIAPYMKMSSVSYNKSGKSFIVDDIMLDVGYNFSEWLLNQLNSRGWTQAELARRAGVSRTAISDVISDKHSAGFELCLAISRALNLPPETVFRAAGLLPPVDEDTEYQEEFFHLLSQLSPQERQEILDLLRFKASRQKNAKPLKPTSRAEKPARTASKEK